MKTSSILCWSVAALAALASSPGLAQSISPMRQLVTSYSDTFSIRVHPQNPYAHRVRMEVKVYDQNFRLIPARVSPKSMMLAAGASRAVAVTVPFLGDKKKKIRICAESIPFANQPTIIKARVCGRFMATRRQ